MIACCAVNGRPSRQRWLGKGGDEPVAQAPDDGAAGGLDGGLDHDGRDGRGRSASPPGSSPTDRVESTMSVNKRATLFADHFTTVDQGVVVVEDSLLEFGQLRGGVDAEFFAQVVLGSSIGAEGVGLSPIPVEGQHVLGPERLSKRVLGCQRLQLANHCGMTSQGEVGFDPDLDG